MFCLVLRVCVLLDGAVTCFICFFCFIGTAVTGNKTRENAKEEEEEEEEEAQQQLLLLYWCRYVELGVQ